MINHIKHDSKRDKEYNEKARAIQADNSLTCEGQKEKTNALLKEYLEKVFGKPVRVWE